MFTVLAPRSIAIGRSSRPAASASALTSRITTDSELDSIVKKLKKLPPLNRPRATRVAISVTTAPKPRSAITIRKAMSIQPGRVLKWSLRRPRQHSTCSASRTPCAEYGGRAGPLARSGAPTYCGSRKEGPVGEPWSYAVVAAAVLGINLLPAFGPPTWAVLVLFTVHGDFHEPLLVLVGAVAAASRRLLLAYVTRRLRQFVP